MPRLASCSRTGGRLAIAANTRALGFPSCPPQAPQSRADSNGLFSVVLPCAHKSTSRAKFFDQAHHAQGGFDRNDLFFNVNPVRVIRSMRA